MSGFVSAGTRPLRMYGAILLVASAAFAVATIACALTIPHTGTAVLAAGRPGTPITLSTAKASGQVKVLAATVADASTTTADSCTISGNHPKTILTSNFSLSGSTTYDGRTYRPFMTLGSGWNSGDQLTCTGPHLAAVLVARENRLPRIALTALLAFVTVGSAILGLVGVTLRRR